MDVIEQKGVVTAVTHEGVKVSFVRGGACGDCHSKKVCGVESEERFVIVQTQRRVVPGDTVILMMQRCRGDAAVMIAYLAPLVLFTAFFFIFEFFVCNEVLSAVGAFLVLVVYFGVLCFFRKHLSKEFVFQIKDE